MKIDFLQDAPETSDAEAQQLAQEQSAAAFKFVQRIAMDLSGDEDLELPGFPDVVIKLQKALSDENGSLKDVARIINSEPALAARLMQLANSAAFRQSTDPVGELRTAVAMLGLNIVRATATNFAMQQMQQQDWLEPLRPDLRQLWESTNYVAAVAYIIAKQLDAMPADKAMLAGLFHQLGKLYLLTIAYRDDPSVLEDPAWPHIMTEWHPTITRAILDSWGLPEDITYATESQDAVQDGQTDNLDRLSLVVSAAKYFATAEEDRERLEDVTFSGKSFTEIADAYSDDIKQLVATIS